MENKRSTDIVCPYEDKCSVENKQYCEFAKLNKDEQLYNERRRKEIERHGDCFNDNEKLLEQHKQESSERIPYSVEKHAENNEIRRALLLLLEDLPLAQRRRVYMRFFLDMKLEQIALLEDVSFQAVDFSIKNAIKRLKQLIAEEWGNFFSDYP